MSASDVATYKAVLQSIIDKRPSGMRLRIAKSLGKHKSFVSQITNPAYAIPVPARHVEAILSICRASTDERASFLRAYQRAHPDRAKGILADDGRQRQMRTISVDVPVVGDPNKQAALERIVRDFASRLEALVDDD